MLHDSVRDRLQTATRLSVYDQTAPGSPATPYLVVRSGVGVAAPHRMSITSHWVRSDVTVLAVGATPEGARAAARLAREALTGWRPETVLPPLQELESSPVMTDGQPPADPRYTIALIYRTITPTGAA